MRLIYTVTRPIVNNLNDVIELVIGARDAAPSMRRFGTQVRTRDGGRYSELDRIQRTHNVTTTRIYDGLVSPVASVPTKDQFEEFIESTSNLETFTWDQYATQVGVADNPRLVVNTSRSVSLRRIMRTRYFRGSFNVEEV